MENPAPEDSLSKEKWQVSMVPPGSNQDRGMCEEKRTNDRPEEGGTLNSGCLVIPPFEPIYPFTSTGKSVDFAVLYLLVAPWRPRMRFLLIGSRVSPSLYPCGLCGMASPVLCASRQAVSPRTVARPQLASGGSFLMISSCLVFLQGTCTPFTSRPCWAHTRGCRRRR